ncbi:MAG TPA: twin-arginine translocase TatA/TatE family subunit [Actinomycetota bacterium]|nr:twin-arginine translocase TatA/TatE family subunit [Actinomycetota bacterium]
MFNIGPLELMVILVIALLVVGPKRLPEVGRSIGRGLREFRKAQDEVQRSIRLSLDEEPPSAPMKGTAAPAKRGEDASGASPPKRGEEAIDAAPPSEPPAPEDGTLPAGPPESGAE